MSAAIDARLMLEPTGLFVHKLRLAENIKSRIGDC